MPLSRRRWIQLGVGGTALLAAGGSVGAWLSTGYTLRGDEAPIVLSTKEFCVLRAVVEVMVPGGGGLPRGVDVDVPQKIDQQIWAAEDATQSDFSAALQLVEHSPLMHGHLARFTRLSVADRADVLKKLSRSSVDVFAAVANGLRTMVFTVYYSQEPTWDAIEYDGPWVYEAKPPASALRYAQLLKARRAERARDARPGRDDV